MQIVNRTIEELGQLVELVRSEGLAGRLSTNDSRLFTMYSRAARQMLGGRIGPIGYQITDANLQNQVNGAYSMLAALREKYSESK